VMRRNVFVQLRRDFVLEAVWPYGLGHIR
jgi:hypothetical protein